MRRLGIIKADTLVGIVSYVGLPLAFVYVVSMVVAPFLIGGDWTYVQDVWDRWQTLNVGVLAFISSVIALNISKINANKQRERQFVAARAFLPHALSELTDYGEASATLLNEAWGYLATDGGQSRPLARSVPEEPARYREIFGRCIAEAEPEVGEYLARILVKLQIHHSRLTELKSSFGKTTGWRINQRNLMTYMFALGKIQASINRIFGFARGEEPFQGSSLDWEDYRNAFANLGIQVMDIAELEDFTKRAIKREN